jgi:16S rRNA (uracil1498-N3)-methyltransferase
VLILDAGRLGPDADRLGPDVEPLATDAGELGAPSTFRLDAQRSHHLVRVLRLQPGASLECFDGRGGRFEATLAVADPRACVVLIGTRLASSTESPLRVTLLQCVSAGERMDWTIEKAVELGVTAIRPLSSARSPLRLDAARAQRRREHWQRLIEAACMQCGRDVLPQLHELQALDRWLADRRRPQGALSLALAPDATRGLREMSFGPEHEIELLVGPESGLDEHELAAARRAGFIGVRLGPRTLRTETAGVAALAALQALAGDF